MASVRTYVASLFSAVVVGLIAGSSSAQLPANDPAEITQSEYEVFSAYIAHYFVGETAKERIGFPVSEIVIVDMTKYDQSEITEDMSWKQVQKHLQKEARSLQPETIKNFLDVNLRQAHLQSRFDLPLPYQLVANSKIASILPDIGGWPQYYKQYPGSQGFLVLSRVGFSPDGKQALFYATNSCGGTCATGSFAVLEKRGRAWTIVKEVILWIS